MLNIYIYIYVNKMVNCNSNKCSETIFYTKTSLSEWFELFEFRFVF